MGAAMIKRQIAVGHQITAYDVSAEALARIEGLGARPVAGLEELADQDLVAIIVLNDEQVLDVAGRLVPVLPSGSTLVIHSTVLPRTILAVEALAIERGIGVVDAPVTGASWAAERGEVNVLVGGADETIDACSFELEALGPVFRMGALGSGEAMKIVNNMMQLGHYALAHEGLRLAETLGIDPERARVAALAGSGSSWTLANLDKLDALNAAAGTGRESWFGKDTWLALLLGHDVKVRLPVAAVVYQLMHGYVAERRERWNERNAAPID
jgi:3-hydroxyisobutyrate dehydrogenase-like beta-hydroxyacid dehydrogenase